ncbi:hypothetical protein LQ51_24465 [Micromonospora sp. HK10]|nr:hypothetical protein LQ51_24465 [Micromonospora sp. HK10]
MNTARSYRYVRVQFGGIACGRTLIGRTQAIRPMLAAAMGSPAFADAALAGWAAMVETPERVTDDVAAVLGRPARSFDQWATDHAVDFA